MQLKQNLLLLIINFLSQQQQQQQQHTEKKYLPCRVHSSVKIRPIYTRHEVYRQSHKSSLLVHREWIISDWSSATLVRRYSACRETMNDSTLRRQVAPVSLCRTSLLTCTSRRSSPSIQASKTTTSIIQIYCTKIGGGLMKKGLKKRQVSRLCNLNDNNSCMNLTLTCHTLQCV